MSDACSVLILLTAPRPETFGYQAKVKTTEIFLKNWRRGKGEIWPVE